MSNLCAAGPSRAPAGSFLHVAPDPARGVAGWAVLQEAWPRGGTAGGVAGWAGLGCSAVLWRRDGTISGMCSYLDWCCCSAVPNITTNRYLLSPLYLLSPSVYLFVFINPVNHHKQFPPFTAIRSDRRHITYTTVQSTTRTNS